jgi:hypothetical protein
LAFFFAASRFHFGSAANAARSMPNLRLRNGSETAQERLSRTTSGRPHAYPFGLTTPLVIAVVVSYMRH